jgi:hypothetical protein
MRVTVWTALSCVDGSFYARVNLSDFDVCRLRSCVRPFDAVDMVLSDKLDGFAADPVLSN